MFRTLNEYLSRPPRIGPPPERPAVNVPVRQAPGKLIGTRKLRDIGLASWGRSRNTR